MIAIKDLVVAYLCIVAFTVMSAPSPDPEAFIPSFLPISGLFDKFLGKKKKDDQPPKKEDPVDDTPQEDDKIKDDDDELPFEELKKLDPEAIKKLSKKIRKAVTEEQRKELSKKQLAALDYDLKDPK